MPTTPLSRSAVKNRNLRRKASTTTTREQKRNKIKAKTSTTKSAELSGIENKTTDSMGNRPPLDTHTTIKDKGTNAVLHAEETEVVDIPIIEDQSVVESNSELLDEVSIHTEEEDEDDDHTEEEDKDDDHSASKEVDDYEMRKHSSPRIYFMNVKFTISASDKVMQDIRNKYVSLFTTLLDADDDLELLSADPEKPQPSILDPAQIPNKMTKIGKYFQTTSRPPKEDEADIWSTFRIKTSEDWEDIIQATEYDLRDENIVLMRKRLQCYKTTTPGYFQFIDNKIDPFDLYNQISADVGRIGLWTIVVKKPWEGFQKKDKKKRKSTGFNKEDFLAKTAHIECMMGEGDKISSVIRRWIKRGKAEQRFGPHIKFIEALTTLSHPQQVERTIRMNAYGKRFQTSIDMVELSGLNNPDGLYSEDCPTIRRRILAQCTSEDDMMFLSVTKKWGSNLWQATYIKQRRTEAIDFASCSAAWLTHGESEDFQNYVFKSYDPHAVAEARDSEWDNETNRVITPSEKEANEDEAEAANIPWLLDLDKLDEDEDAAEVKFTGGVNFNFNEDVSVKTTRVTEGTQDDNTNNTPSPGRRSNFSILKSPSDVCSINSAITMDTRMTTLETTLGQILVFMQTAQAKSVSSDNDQTSEVTPQDVAKVTTPILPKGGVGE